MRSSGRSGTASTTRILPPAWNARSQSAVPLAAPRQVDRTRSRVGMERALAVLLGRDGSAGRPRVLRLPAALSTPESWEIHLDGVERTTVTAIRDAGRTGRFS